jgi:class 3 adenylate cyclase
VDIVPGIPWAARFDRVLSRATEVIVASSQRLGTGSTSYEYAFRLLDGNAGVRADELDTDLLALAVWDGREGDGAGGTAAAVEHWRRAGRRVDVIDAARLLRECDAGEVRTAPVAPLSPPRPVTSPGPGFDPHIVGLLFADVAGFSRLTDAELPLFVAHGLGAVADQIARMSSPPLLTNTWGDGIYIVFASVRDAGTFALGLRDAVRSADWIGKGFAAPMGIRIGLHAGPAYACQDPVTGRPSFIGAHVSRAARIEPITPPGEVYASRAFAALARAEGVREFVCTHVGPTPLAKGYGTFPTYVVSEPPR